MSLISEDTVAGHGPKLNGTVIEGVDISYRLAPWQNRISFSKV